MNRSNCNDFHRRKFCTKLRQFSGRPDLTPLVDVFFILLLFFLFSSSFIQISGIQFELPCVDAPYSSGGLERHVITVSWSPGGNQIYFNERPMTLDMLKAELGNIDGRGSRILLYCDYRVSSGDALEILTLARKAGLPVTYATMPGSKMDQAVFE